MKAAEGGRSVPEVLDATRVLSDDELVSVTEILQAQGVTALRGSFVDTSGVLRAKQVPLANLRGFNRSGLGASTSWAVFAADDLLAMTPNFSAVGDMRLRADLDAVVDLGDGTAWAPIDLVDQDGKPLPFCPRHTLRRQITAGQDQGVTVLAATEVEFSVFLPDGTTPAGQSYSYSRLSANQAFVDDVMSSCEKAGLDLEQFHAEYGPGQFELTVPPADPLTAADRNTLLRILLSRSARRVGWRATFSPKPIKTSIGNGAHAHMSFFRDGRPLLSGGSGPYGMTEEGARIVTGLVAALPDIAGALASSALSSLRLQPSTWSGAYACWGLENREAAIRYCAATNGNMRGANIEVKCVDPSVNIYAAYAVLVGTALESLAEDRPLPDEVTVDPALLSDEERRARGITLVGADLQGVLERFSRSALVHRVLGDALVETILAVRQHEVDLVASRGLDEVAELLQYAWSA